MTGKIKQQTHLTSLRLRKELHDWVKAFAARWDTTPAYVYRAAVKDFIKAKSAELR